LRLVPEIALPYFLSLPAGEARAAVVVIHEGNGISPQLLRFCQRLAGEGYAVVAPDFFYRFGGSEAADPMTMYAGLTPELFLSDLRIAAALVRGAGSGKLGITGFCMGGRLSYLAAVDGQVDAAVGFYGRIADELGEPKCPTKLFYGGNDPWIPAADIEKIAAYHAGSAITDVTVYPAAGHGFMRDGSDDFFPDEAGEAYAKLLDHFAEHLG
jgi:carboxymethylenebutenolidase